MERDTRSSTLAAQPWGIPADSRAAIRANLFRSHWCAGSLSTRACQTAITSNPFTGTGNLKLTSPAERAAFTAQSSEAETAGISRLDGESKTRARGAAAPSENVAADVTAA